MFKGQKNVALWSAVQLVINYFQEKFNYANVLWASLQSSSHCRKGSKIFSGCIYTGIAPVLLMSDQNYHEFWGTVGFFFPAIFQSICVFIPRFLAGTCGTLVWKHWSSVKVNAWSCTITVPYVVLVWCLTLRWLMSYIYGAPILDVSRSHTTTQHSR